MLKPPMGMEPLLQIYIYIYIYIYKYLIIYRYLSAFHEVRAGQVLQAVVQRLGMGLDKAGFKTWSWKIWQPYYSTDGT